MSVKEEIKVVKGESFEGAVIKSTPNTNLQHSASSPSSLLSNITLSQPDPSSSPSSPTSRYAQARERKRLFKLAKGSLLFQEEQDQPTPAKAGTRKAIKLAQKAEKAFRKGLTGDSEDGLGGGSKKGERPEKDLRENKSVEREMRNPPIVQPPFTPQHKEGSSSQSDTNSKEALPIKITRYQSKPRASGNKYYKNFHNGLVEQRDNEGVVKDNESLPNEESKGEQPFEELAEAFVKYLDEVKRAATEKDGEEKGNMT